MLLMPRNLQQDEHELAAVSGEGGSEQWADV
jgi:hypothetical protein